MSLVNATPAELAASPFVPSTAKPVSGSMSAAGENVGPFAPQISRPFNVTSRPAAFAGSYQLERKFAGDANWYVVIGYADLVDLPESFALTETEDGVTYRWNMTARTAGNVAARISA